MGELQVSDAAVPRLWRLRETMEELKVSDEAVPRLEAQGDNFTSLDNTFRIPNGVFLQSSKFIDYLRDLSKNIAKFAQLLICFFFSIWLDTRCTVFRFFFPFINAIFKVRKLIKLVNIYADFETSFSELKESDRNFDEKLETTISMDQGNFLFAKEAQINARIMYFETHGNVLIQNPYELCTVSESI